MATYSKVSLSGTVHGLPIPVVAVGAGGTLLHTAQATTTGWDEVYLWAANVDSVSRLLWIEWGGIVDPDNHLIHSYSIPAHSAAIQVAMGQVLNNGLIVSAFADNASKINITGFVNRISP